MSSSNEYIELSDKQLKKMVNNYRYYRKDINNTRISILQEIKELDDMIAAISLPGYSVDSEGGKTNKKQDPVFLSYIKLTTSRYREKIIRLQQDLSELNQKEIAFDRVMSAFRCTMWICPIAYEIVTRLCVNVEKIDTWETVAADLCVSKSYLSEARNFMYELVRIIYKSDYDTEDIDSMTEENIYALVEAGADESLLKRIDKF